MCVRVVKKCDSKRIKNLLIYLSSDIKSIFFYRVRGNNIEAVRIIMAKRDFMQIMFGNAEE